MREPFDRSTHACSARPGRARSRGVRCAGARRERLKGALPVAALLLVLSAARAASARELDLGLFLPPIGRAATLRIEDPTPDRHGTFRVGLVLDYAHRPLARAAACNGAGAWPAVCGSELQTRALVSDLARADLSLALALYDRFELGLALPFALARSAEDPESRLDSRLGFADLRAGFGFALAQQGSTRVAVRLDTTWPTAGTRTWSGSPNWSVTPALVWLQALPHLQLAAKLGYLLRERALVFGIEQDDELIVHLGAAYDALPRLSVVTDAGARIGIGGYGMSARELALELDLGVRLQGPGSVQFALAVGTHVVPLERRGYAPDVRGLVAMRIAVEPRAAEDVEPVASLSDSDADGLADDEDACVFDAEDRDGFADDDGCPDRDNDGDGILDGQDACPEQSEDSDGFHDRDGCPEVDNDRDGVADGGDRCRMAPEDRDGFEDFDGCPEPGPARPVVTLSGSRSLVADTIYFEGQADSIHPASQPLLDELARTLQRLPPHKRVRIEGHTDDTGNPERNVDLSYRRAKAVVEYLKARGVPEDRLEYVGYGGQRPLADNRTPEGRALNRRVQFSLIDAPR